MPSQPDTSAFITISAINNGKLRLDKATRCVTHQYYEALKASRRPCRGDILYSVTGSIGVPALVDTDAAFTFQRHIAILRPKPTNVLSFYLLFALGVDETKQQALNIATGTAQLTIPLSGLRDFIIPTPPLSEQAEIVRRVEALFALADRIEARVEAARAQVDRLTPAILAKAFRGALVPQDPADEPASALLERLRQQAAAAKPARRGRGTARQVVAAPAAESLTASASRAKPFSTHATPAQIPARPSSASPAENAKAPAHHAPPRATLDENDLVALLRAVIDEQGSCDRATAIQLTAYALGYQRVSKVVGAAIDTAIRTAVRRGVLVDDDDELRVPPASRAERKATIANS